MPNRVKEAVNDLVQLIGPAFWRPTIAPPSHSGKIVPDDKMLGRSLVQASLSSNEHTMRCSESVDSFSRRAIT